MSAPRKVVKRYANRKLYDTERSCYVTLEDIANMIKAGDEVQVIDNKSGDDLTSVTLAQIIFETEKKKSFMPLNLLRDLIQQRSEALGAYARDQVGRAQARAQDVLSSAQNLRETAQRVRGEVENRLGIKEDGSVDEGAEELSPEARSKSLRDLMAASKDTFVALEKSIKDKVGTVSSSVAPEIEEIRRRINNLEDKFLH